MSKYDVAVIGAGPAGLAAALEARKKGASRVVLLERDKRLGGILPQCIHNGFGSIIFKRDYPGPLYAGKFIDQLEGSGIEIIADAMVMDITGSRKIYLTSRKGYREIQARAIVLAMGCREKTRGQIRIPGSRPAGVFTAGTVQRLVNVEGFMPGSRFVILGSGDIGMIMARRLTMEGAKVECVVEAMPHLTGLRRNYVQCLEDFHIPLRTGFTVKQILGRERVEGVIIIKVDSSLNYVPGTEEMIPCDTLLFSVGLIPENELSLKAGVDLDPLTGGPIIDDSCGTSVEGLFAAGNVVTIYDLVDYVSTTAAIAGARAAEYALGPKGKKEESLDIRPGRNIRSLVPQKVSRGGEDFLLQFRVKRNFEEKMIFELSGNGRSLYTFKESYARSAEMIIRKIKKKHLPPSGEIILQGFPEKGEGYGN